MTARDTRIRPARTYTQRDGKLVNIDANGNAKSFLPSGQEDAEPLAYKRRTTSLRRAEIERRWAAESFAVWTRLPTDLPAGGMFMHLARSANCDFWFSSPTTVEIDIPKWLPEPLRNTLKFYFVLNGKAVARLLEEEGGAA